MFVDRGSFKFLSKTLFPIFKGYDDRRVRDVDTMPRFLTTAASLYPSSRWYPFPSLAKVQWF